MFRDIQFWQAVFIICFNAETTDCENYRPKEMVYSLRNRDECLVEVNQWKDKFIAILEQGTGVFHLTSGCEIAILKAKKVKNGWSLSPYIKGQ
jgi:hypothetical protein